MFKRWLQQTTMATMVALAPLSVMAEETPKQGGDIVVTYKDDITTLDPAIGYDWVNWSMIKSLYSRLMDYAPGTPNPVPSLAESFTVSPDGLIYTFKLHKGVKFSNGREVVASDVKYSIERAVDPKTQGPGAGFFGAIKGFEDETGGKTTTLSGIETPDDSTVIFNLSRPDATFLHVLAINFASVVPKEAVEAAAGDFGKKPVGSGTFILKDWTIGQQLVFERNKDYFVKGVPYIDSFKVEVGQEPLVALLRLQKGEVDIAGDGIPPAKFLEIKNSADGAQMIVDGEQLHTGYITLNTKVKPFDNVKVRQALNMAINKDRITRILNGRATPANQPLPPLMPGYDKAFTGYAYDVAKAKALLAEAGYPDGFETVLYSTNTDPQPRIAQAIQQDLAAVGVKAEVRALAQANVISAGGTEGEAPMIWSGGMAWIADFPDPSNFYGPILGCAGAVPGGWNWSWYCNADLDKRAVAADSMSDPAKAAERTAAWGKVFTDIMADAPWIPVINERRVVAKSLRMGGADNIYIDPTRVINYDAIYVKQ
ncbi:ABC transporter substrate-binding protein [Rhizobium ruizarguesonis]|jgi:peptide/nickel transport system substrate-binding protein/oligopeptide transport system substrate-binding protein|uniref:Glutathione-binding protein GsiB n=1 Tax=Rhizobium ruizarguesonis TaxID=2081791 RepID=A0ABY1X0R3_9HYPH|nr:ABC transporter substrate-binding protein [Rhizobium ruizarguesonis]MBY5871595.1 ABC transporter substrate-binding protein [Rhizobium leguminosarum]NKL17220.1 ABC transporter substrate-binding protein [Rhizobium leguminosarum bv. viciae]MBY5893827.1 ABC transporter substrate-binding protein [Rhizobium leguminosarum]NEH28306.1 ABC transporter substrate-binding protein [Rhizobium ruizarguesonis]NEH75359.1 ABC transporter substrate-binding protein [Rhizobium ruizarguesonis]